MIEHACDECGSTKHILCYCQTHLDEIKHGEFENGKEEGEILGYNKAKEELN